MNELLTQTEKECVECLKTLPISEFYTNGIHTNANGTKRQRYKPRCKSCENSTDYRNYLKKVAQAVKDSGRVLECEMCGYDKSYYALEFHHIDESEKAFEISKRKKASYDTLKAEIDKCAILCSNCHREHHGKGVLTPLDVMNYAA